MKSEWGRDMMGQGHDGDAKPAATEGTGLEKTMRPANEDELADLVRAAASDGRRLSVRGTGSKAGIGRPVVTDLVVETTAFDGIVFHEPEELVFSARAGTPLSQIESTLAEKGQMLAFEPPDLSRLLGNADRGSGTLGGMIAAGLAGPRRVKQGGVRDHLLGFRAINGRGEPFRSGGRVVKNVTGYDLSKLMCGSWGTLAILIEATFKVLPAPERTLTLLWQGLDLQQAQALMTEAMKSPVEVSAAVHLPPGLDGEEVARTALRLEGFARSVEARAQALTQRLEDHGRPAARLHTEESLRFWRNIRDVAPLHEHTEAFVWRIIGPPAQGAERAQAIQTLFEDAAFFMDWAGGLIWLAAPGAADVESAQRQAEALRAIVKDDGHVTLIRAPEEIRRKVPVFHPQPSSLARLAERVRASFDPHGILEPGRMTPLSARPRQA